MVTLQATDLGQAPPFELQATAEQMNLFARLYPMNARPLQAGSGRLIKESQ